MRTFGIFTAALALTCLPVFGYGKSVKTEVIVSGIGAESGASAGELRTFKNEAFKKGEVLKFMLHYGFIDAGEAILEVRDEEREIGGRKVYHMVGLGYSKGSFDWFYKVRDRYETYVDEKALVPWVFIRRVNEGGYIINQDYIFNHYKKKVDIGEGKVFDTPENVQDMLSAFYFARCIDFSNAKPGDIYTIPAFVDKEVYPMKIKFVGKETIKTDLGKIRCLKFRPVVQKGRIFKKEEDLNVWITDDKNHIPVRAQADILVGSIKMDLISYSNLANPISKVN
jgi:hypothetical protein